MDEREIFILIVNCSNYTNTVECVESLKDIEYENYRIVIVDDGSFSDSYNKLKEKCLNCVIIRSERNLWFAGGNNVGIKYALANGADYILLLNNDTIVEKDFLTHMVKTAEEDERIGIVGCKINYYEKRDYIWFAGGKIDWFKFRIKHIGQKEIDRGQYDKKTDITFMTGCCMLIRRKVFEKVGLLPEEYFMYFEDVDFCVRVLEEGFRIIYEPKAKIYHKVGFSSGGEESPFALKWNNRNRILFMKKYKSKVGKRKFVFSLLFFFVTRCIRMIQFLLKGEREKTRAIIKGIKEGLVIYCSKAGGSDI
ncbi:glycosyltransferase family 2 protein [Caldicellulosiruptor changbaiensis]|uniref:Glycosyltransferase family 2 protein n=1 Tax=Caldicellulosiruptor changbaiensis TaxID=1222016 RepID=A0A3T0D8R0_9FIRM|nr:glycosyltransferase family 2 protein [Caldicellulosiruptor changbaiensis]AZT91535.1 glycosyltransferase family 2 protein [Caldicellulosiruptor changbaiensis]